MALSPLPSLKKMFYYLAKYNLGYRTFVYLCQYFSLFKYMCRPYLYRWLPESVRWLYTQRRFGEVEKVLIKIAELNKTTDELPTVIESLNSSKHNGKSKTSQLLNIPLVLNYLVLVFFRVCFNYSRVNN